MPITFFTQSYAFNNRFRTQIARSQQGKRMHMWEGVLYDGFKGLGKTVQPFYAGNSMPNLKSLLWDKSGYCFFGWPFVDHGLPADAYHIIREEQKKKLAEAMARLQDMSLL